jgi:hypothetical protein
MIKCAKECMKNKTPCQQSDCRKWIDYKEDMNCCLISIENNDDKGLTLQETGKRLGLSFVRIRQIEKAAIAKLHNIVTKNKNFL